MPRRTPPRGRAQGQRGMTDTAPATPGLMERFITNMLPDMDTSPAKLIPVTGLVQVDLSKVVPAEETDIKDMEVIDPVEGSPFQRKGMAECITDEYDSLTKFKLYRIEELSEDGDEFQLMDDRGLMRWFNQKLFKAIDHGPFRPDDTVRIDDVTGLVDSRGTQLSHDYDEHQWIVLKQKDDQVQVSYSGLTIWAPCLQVKMMKRSRFYDSNPFHKGDRVKVIKSIDKYRIYAGDVYTVSVVRDDRIALEELGPDAAMQYHVNFAKYTTKVKSFKKKKSTITMTDLIRKTINDNCYKKLSPYDVLKILKDKMPNEEITINEVNKQMKEMFRW